MPRGPGRARPYWRPSEFELRGSDAVALSNDLAARDLRRVGNRRAEVLVGDPLRDDLRGLFALRRSLEETKRAQDAIARLDQVIAGETGELAELRDERLLDLAGDLVRAGRVDAFVTTNGGMHGDSFCRPSGQSARLGALRRSGQGHDRRRTCSLNGFNI